MNKLKQDQNTAAGQANIPLDSVTPEEADMQSSLYYCSFLLGLGLLTPFNMTLNLIPYLSEAYAWPEVAYFTALSLTYPSIVVQFVLLPFGQQLTSLSRIRYSLVGSASALLLLGTVGVLARPLGILLMVIGGACTAVLEGSLFGWLSCFPNPLFSQGAMSGVALAGVLATALQLLLRAIFPGQHSLAAGVYTVAGVAILCLCIAAHKYMASMPCVLVWQEKGPTDTTSSDDSKSKSTVAPEGCSIGGEQSPAVIWEKGVWPEPQNNCEKELVDKVPLGLCGTPGLHARLLLGLLIPIASLILNFICTFMVFPGLISSVRYKGGGGFGALYEPGEWFVLQLLVFGISDAIARGVASRSAKSPPPQQFFYFYYALARFALVPLLYFCACSDTFNDTSFTFFVVLLGGTGGHLASLLMMHAPKLVAGNEKETAGLVLVAALHIGIVVGSNAALFFEAHPCS